MYIQIRFRDVHFISSNSSSRDSTGRSTINPYNGKSGEELNSMLHGVHPEKNINGDSVFDIENPKNEKSLVTITRDLLQSVVLTENSDCYFHRNLWIR